MGSMWWSLAFFVATHQALVLSKMKQSDVDWLEAKSKQPGVVKLPSGLMYSVLQSGPRDGKSPTISQGCVCEYNGTTTDGNQFDAGTAVIAPGSVMKGLTEAMQLMKPGDRWELYIPSRLGYGDKGSEPEIPPGAALVFDLKLIELLEPKKKILPPGHTSPESACGSAIQCLNEYNGLSLQSIATSESNVAIAWRQATLHYRLRAAGSAFYDYGRATCNIWLSGLIDNSIFGNDQFSDVAVAGGLVGYILLFTGIMAFVVASNLSQAEDQEGESEEEDEDAAQGKSKGEEKFVTDQAGKNNSYSKCSENTVKSKDAPCRTWRTPVARMSRITSWLTCTLAALPLSLFCSELGIFQGSLDAWCTKAFGAESKYQGDPAWLSLLVENGGERPREGFALYSEFVDEDYDEDLADPSEPHRDPSREALMATTMKIYVVAGPESLRLAEACEEFGAKSHLHFDHSRASSAVVLFLRWLEVGGFGCRSKISGAEATLFVSHSLMDVRRARLLMPEESAKIIKLAEAQAEKSGWANSYTDFAAVDLSRNVAVEGIQSQIASRVSSLLRVEDFGLNSHEWFVAKSSVNEPSNLNMYPDGEPNTVVTYNVLLNDQELGESVTYLEPYMDSAELVAGMSVTFASTLRHSSTQVANGTRYVLVGSCAFRSAATPLVGLGHKLSTWGSERALRIFALSTVGSCFALLLCAGYIVWKGWQD